MPGEERIERQDVEAFLETRRELGPAYEREIVDAFAERIEKAVEQRTAADAGLLGWERREQAAGGKRQLALGIVSLVASIPITIPLALNDHLAAVTVSWLGIAAVNAAHAATVTGRRRRDRR